ncbi:protein NATD1-like isoform X1 [Acanthopagrus latus]|uniref:protein NATD1-like isoform X1 n=1 Tax=Acanthopagrus latus TaxID=8177 RepID=UPI00187C7F78|nr:protein NATD1-like isoform X1 [Acanthopagrus latus]
MAFKLFSRLGGFPLRLNSPPVVFRFLSSSCGLTVNHDRQNLRFTVSPDSGAGSQDCAVLQYKFTGEKEVDLMSTFVPETFRGQGVAAVLSQAAMDFLVEENLKAHISCWYIKKYIEEHPHQHYKELVIT